MHQPDVAPTFAHDASEEITLPDLSVVSEEDANENEEDVDPLTRPKLTSPGFVQRF